MEGSRIIYGDIDINNQYIKVYPPRIAGALTFVIIHGGFWKEMYTLDYSMIDTICPYLLSQGYGVCLIEYRRVGHVGGGWPGTNEDILSAMRKLYSVSQESSLDIDFNRIVVLGHSSGATLALWTCSKLEKRNLPFRPLLCVPLAPIGDLVTGHKRRLSCNGDAIPLYIGCEPDEASPNCPYKQASPHYLLPLQIDTLLVGGNIDEDVPCDLVHSFYDAAVLANTTASAVGDVVPKVELLSIENCGHDNMVTATDKAWLSIMKKIVEMTS